MDALEGEVLDAYQAIGLIHLFSISGFSSVILSSLMTISLEKLSKYLKSKSI